MPDNKKQNPGKSEEPKNIRHVFDGIEEEDNDLPRWWLNLFYVTIVFAVFYLAWFHWPIGKGSSPEEEFSKDFAKLEEAAAVAKAAGFDYNAVLEDEAFIAAGKETYSQMCVPCHGDHGQGSVGPNLTDDFWIIEPSLSAMEHIIANGNLEKGMPAWEPVVGPDKVKQLVVFVRSMRSQNVADGKEPQGNPGKLP